MSRKTRGAVAAAAIAGLLTLGTAVTAAADPTPAPPPPAPSRTWVPVMYFATQTYCVRAGITGQRMGVLPPGAWMCDSGWLMRLA